MIYHIVKETDYVSALEGESYQPADFHVSGFVHCSLEASVIPVANDYYSSVDDKLLLLRIDPSKLKSQTKYEAAAPEEGMGTTHIGSSSIFPHIYGPIDRGAVDGIGVLRKENGRYLWPNEFVSPARFLSGKEIVHRDSGGG